MSQPACLCCGSTAIQPLYTVPDRYGRGGGPYDIVACAHCGFGFVHPVPSGDQAEEYFDSYWGREPTGITDRLIAAYKGLLAQTEARLILRHCGRGRLLDVGCGDGQLLALLRRRGCQVEGTEVSRAGWEHARRAHGLTVHYGALDDLDLPQESFDTVILSSVLEHVADPASLLGRVHRLLRPGGHLYIVVPNSESLQAQWLKERWVPVQPPQHLLYFTPRSLDLLLARCGFRRTVVRHGMLRHSPATLVSSIFPSLEPHRVQRLGLSRRALRSAVFLGLTYCVLPFLYLERLLRRGGIIVVVAGVMTGR